MSMNKQIAHRQQQLSDAVIEQFRGIAASTLGHLTNSGYLRGIRPLFDGARLVGNVVTVKVHLPDGSILRDALLNSLPGDVLVIECVGDEHCACWGELRTLAGLIKGLAGVVVSGASPTSPPCANIVCRSSAKASAPSQLEAWGKAANSTGRSISVGWL